jgi:hypothetical protein
MDSAAELEGLVADTRCKVEVWLPLFPYSDQALSLVDNKSLEHYSTSFDMNQLAAKRHSSEELAETQKCTAWLLRWSHKLA